MVELARQNKLDPAKVISIEAEVFQLAYDFADGGLYGVDKAIQTKEQADHSLPYLLAVALLDGDVMPAQRIIKADVQGLLKKVSVRPNHEYTEQYPQRMPAKITVRLLDGKVLEHDVQDYPGLASHPFSWEESVEKFDRLVAGRADEGLCREIKDAVLTRKHPSHGLDEIAGFPQGTRLARSNTRRDRDDLGRAFLTEAFFILAPSFVDVDLLSSKTASFRIMRAMRQSGDGRHRGKMLPIWSDLTMSDCLILVDNSNLFIEGAKFSELRRASSVK